MATSNKCILGAFYGKVGTVIGSTWRGKDVMGSLPRKSPLPHESFRVALQQNKVGIDYEMYSSPLPPESFRVVNKKN